ncbi:cystatin domain protein [Necator americanus]|uniref:Cystatin domain protein n=1 Tax=Necator americanus TaxID=51031 RepID=W2T8P5_NECAM|nr:cystatin domain protein [Necator americanus]ETN77352.1 cystatin domain protein [Necator americanus]
MSHLVSSLALLSIVIFVESRLGGGIETLKASDPENMKKAWKTVNAVNEKLDDGHNLMVPVEVVKAGSQKVVAGTRYIFEIMYAESTCMKGQESPATAALCLLKPNGRRALYKVEMWKIPMEFTVTKIADIPAKN